MLDNDDVSFVALAANPTSPGGCLVLVIVLVVMLVIVHFNREECAEMECPDGMASKLMDHECLCVTGAKPKTHAADPPPTPGPVLDRHGRPLKRIQD